MKSKWILILSAVATALFVSCDPGQFMPQSEFSLQSSGHGNLNHSDGEGFGTELQAPPAAAEYKTDLRYLNGEQAFNSLLSLTGQPWNEEMMSLAKSGYENSLTFNPNLAELSPAYIMMNTNLVFRVCRNLINKEMAASNVSQRRFLASASGALPLNSEKDVIPVAERYAYNFWARNLTSEEKVLISSFYQEFYTLDEDKSFTVERARAFYEALCSVMLGSLESMTY